MQPTQVAPNVMDIKEQFVCFGHKPMISASVQSQYPQVEESVMPVSTQMVTRLNHGMLAIQLPQEFAKWLTLIMYRIQSPHLL